MSLVSSLGLTNIRYSRPLAAVLGFALAYFVLCRVSLAFVFQQGGAAAIWPPAGVALAAILVLGRSHRWTLLAAIGLANLAANLLVTRPLVLSVGLVIPNLLLALSGEWIYCRLAGRSIQVDSLRRSSVLLFVVVPVSSAIGAFVGSCILTIYAGLEFQSTFRGWWIADTLGLATTTPFLLLAMSSRRAVATRTYYLELAAFFIATMVLGCWVFSLDTTAQEVDLRRPYVLIALHCWAALRLRARDAAALVAVTSLVVIWFTTRSCGPFALTGLPALQELLDAELYLIMIAATSLLISALISERARQAKRLIKATAARAEVDRLEHLRLITAAIPDYIAYITRDGRLQFTNQPYGIGGSGSESPLSKPLREVVGEANYKRLEPHIRQALAGEQVSFETPYQRSNGTNCQLRISYVPHVAETGEQLGFYCHATDITQQKVVEEQLRRYQSDLDKVARLTTMGELAGGLAHELNQPLSAIHNYARGCVRRLQGSVPDAKVLESALECISQEASRAGEIIEGLRRHFRRRHLDRSPVMLAEMIRRVLRICQHELSNNDITATFTDSSLVSSVPVDAVLAEQVLLNLIRNAIEAMKEVERVRRLSIEIRSPAANLVEILVSDSGGGYAAENQDRLFEKFFTTKVDGLGMGLPISRSIVEAHGGRLVAHRNEPWGATFRFTLSLDA